MSAATTRLLLLGAVALFEPVNGYQIRRELLSWRVDEWASVNPGSIYHGLRSLAEKGFLSATTVEDGGRDVVVYEITETGRGRLRELIEEAVVDVNVFDRRAFLAAFGMLPVVGDAWAESALAKRRQALVDELDGLADGERGDEYKPPHALRTLDLWMRLAWTELAWLDEVLAALGAGDLTLVLDGAWTPPADDPGHQMNEDRERYRSALGRD